MVKKKRRGVIIMSFVRPGERLLAHRLWQVLERARYSKHKESHKETNKLGLSWAKLSSNWNWN